MVTNFFKSILGASNCTRDHAIRIWSSTTSDGTSWNHTVLVSIAVHRFLSFLNLFSDFRGLKFLIFKISRKKKEWIFFSIFFSFFSRVSKNWEIFVKFLKGFLKIKNNFFSSVPISIESAYTARLKSAPGAGFWNIILKLSQKNTPMCC